jgi:hypothetical protein
MIDTALKHFIYDICIDQIFNAIQKNFIPAKQDAWRQLKQGYHYQWIEATAPSGKIETYYDVYVLHTTRRRLSRGYIDISHNPGSGPRAVATLPIELISKVAE